MECKIFRILLNHVSDHSSVLFQYTWLYLKLREGYKEDTNDIQKPLCDIGHLKMESFRCYKNDRGLSISLARFMTITFILIYFWDITGNKRPHFSQNWPFLRRKLVYTEKIFCREFYFKSVCLFLLTNNDEERYSKIIFWILEKPEYAPNLLLSLWNFSSLYLAEITLFHRYSLEGFLLRFQISYSPVKLQISRLAYTTAFSC